MEKRVLREEIIKMHMVQQLERKKALLVNLQSQQGGEPDDCDGIITEEDRRRYKMGGNVTCPNGIFSKQFSLPNYFRGENAYYPTGKSTAYRPMAECENCHDQFTAEQIRSRISESGNTQITVIPEIVDAHYGIPSEWLGFTSNFDEALFYACCTIDEQSGKWRPLEEKDFLAPAQEGGTDRRYGVIYMADAADVRFGEGMDKDVEYNLMTPAGSLPLMRNVGQYAYAMRLRESDDLVRDKRFDRLVFEHSEELCRDIYRRMDAGKMLFDNKKLIK